MRNAIFCCWILFLGMLCRDTSARGSLILGHEESALARAREAQHDDHLYEQMVAVRSHDPTRFDHLHPVFGELLTERSSFEYWLSRWQAHPARFEHWHPLLWRIIDGEALHGGPPIAPPLVPQPDQVVNPPVVPGPISPPEPPRPPGPVGPAVVVPETGSLRLLVVALGLMLVARGGFRLFCTGSR